MRKIEREEKRKIKNYGEKIGLRKLRKNIEKRIGEKGIEIEGGEIMIKD